MAQEIIELESSKLLADFNAGRPMFLGQIGSLDYQVFCFQDGMLFLEVKYSVAGKKR
jgi:hypothetical protein